MSKKCIGFPFICFATIVYVVDSFLFSDLKQLSQIINKKESYYGSIDNRQRQKEYSLKRSINDDKPKDYTIFYIEKKPKIITKLNDVKVLKDQQAIFICSSIGNPIPSMKWLVNDDNVLSKRYIVESISPQKSILRLNPVRLSDDRTRITCQATSAMGSSFSHASLVVYKNKQDIPLGYPILLSKSSVIVNEKNTRVELECQVEGNPKPQILWLKDSAPLDFDNTRIKLLNNGGLEINQTLEEDEGGYECMAANEHGIIVSPVIRLMIRENVEETYQLILKNVSYFPPHFTYVSPDQFITADSSLMLKCQAIGNPMPTVFWKCGQAILLPHSYNSTFHKAEASIVLSDLSESLKCTCIAKNYKESISRSILVRVQDPFVTPANIKVKQITTSTCLISWNQKAFREDFLKYQLVLIKTIDLQNEKNTKSTFIINSKEMDSEKNINYKMEGLSAFTNYTVWIESILNGNNIQSNTITFTTLELPPNSPPRNVELYTISNGALILIWDPPENPNGLITDYSIYYSKDKKIPISQWEKTIIKVISNQEAKQQTILSHLLNNVSYFISISAQNKAGIGPVSEPQEILVKIGVVHGPKNFRAVAKSSTEIQLFWEPIIAKIQINIVSYHLLYMPKLMLHGKIELNMKYSPRLTTISIGNLKPNTTYEFRLFAKTESADGMTSTVECSTSVKAIEEQINVMANAINSTSIEVSWKTTTEMSKQVEVYRIQCRRYMVNEISNTNDVVDVYIKNNAISMKHKNGTAYYIFTQLTPNNQYQIYLNTITRHRSGSVFKSNPIKTWSKRPQKPEYLHLQLSCSSTKPCVKMEWKSVTEDQKTIKGYRVRYYPIMENVSIDSKMYEKNVTNNHFETSFLNHYLGFIYNFKVAAFNEHEIGKEIFGQIYILEGTPSVSSYGFKLKNVSNIDPSSVSFIWNKIPQQNLNGRFNYYQIMCYIVEMENETKIFHKTFSESITINNLLENTNYSCSVRVCTQKAVAKWSDSIYFKTKDVNLPPPSAIRLVRLSHSTAQITWKWNPEFLKYYLYFLIHFADEKSIVNQGQWLVRSTKSTFTKFILKSLNATFSYVVRVSSVSNRGIEGPLSAIVKEMFLTPRSGTAKFLQQLTCSAVSSTSIQLRWSADLNNQALTHFRVNFTGITQSQMREGLAAKKRSEREQSVLIYDKGKFYSHKIINLNPNTEYAIDVEPIFKPDSIMFGTTNRTICTTFKTIPFFIEEPIISSIDKKTNRIEIQLPKPDMENGTIDIYYVVVKVTNDKYKQRKARSISEESIEHLLKEKGHNHNNSDIYVAVSLVNDEIFPNTNPTKIFHKIVLGSGKSRGIFKDRKFHPSFFYRFQILACIRVIQLQFKNLRCQLSFWTKPLSINLSLFPKRKDNLLDTYENTNSYKRLSNNSNALTVTSTTTIVVILGILILSILFVSIFLFTKRQKILKSKFGSVYGSHSTRLTKDKSTCKEHLLKEPFFDSTVRISTSGSLRLKSHTNDYLELNRMQLTSTPDLLVRSPVAQPHGSIVQFHRQQLADRRFDYTPISIEALSERVALLKENEGIIFNKEYDSIEPGQQFSWKNSNMELNRPKNRYANVIAYDHSRVILQPLLTQKDHNETLIIPGSDYINANYISGYLNPKAYIATQGPLPETIGDFWRMIWEQNSSIIIMMTRLEERDRTKCDQYWPLGGKGSVATYSYINVAIVDITELAYYTIRKFHIQKLNDNKSTREIYQLQFTAWPDHGVPNHPAPLLMFLRRIRSEAHRNSSPIVVHCSAGVGRTGAFIVIDYMLEKLKYCNTIDIYNYVTNIRSQRNYMVQTVDQYIFIYETLLEAVQCGNTEIPISDLANHIEKLNQIEISEKSSGRINITRLQREFRNLISNSAGLFQCMKLNASNHTYCSIPSILNGSGLSNHQPLTYETATQTVNQPKNRILQILPPDFSRVSISPIRGVEGSDYINASWIDSYKSRNAYIATQSPLSETSEDFWRCIWEHNSSIIVMLTLLKENNRERCYQYWPYKKSSRFQFFIIDPVAEYNMNTYIMREFKLTDTRDSQTRVIRQFQFSDWQDGESIPHSTQIFLDLINQIHKTKLQLGQDGPITVHCSTGSGRTGIFLALSNVVERIKNELVIDLFQTVRLLKWQRPALLQTEDQYQFCYMAALEYLKIFAQMRFD